MAQDINLEEFILSCQANKQRKYTDAEEDNLEELSGERSFIEVSSAEALNDTDDALCTYDPNNWDFDAESTRAIFYIGNRGEIINKKTGMTPRSISFASLNLSEESSSLQFNLPPPSVENAYKKRKFVDFKELTCEDVRRGFTKSGNCEEGYNIKLSVANRGLKDLRSVSNFTNLTEIDVSGNYLKCVRALGVMQYLENLNASSNDIETFLDICPIPLGLKEVDFSKNCISKILTLKPFWTLTDINLSYNSLTEMDIEDPMYYLKSLDLSHNMITRVNLNCPNLFILNLKSNCLNAIEGLELCPNLCSLNLARNQISELGSLKYFGSLVELHIERNNITDLFELETLKTLLYLHCLWVHHNKISFLEYSRLMFIHTLPQLLSLDGEKITIQEMRDAKNIFNPSSIKLSCLDHTNTLVDRACQSSNVMYETFCQCTSSAPIILIVGTEQSECHKLAILLKEEFRTSIHLGGVHSTATTMEGSNRDIPITLEAFAEMKNRGDFLTTSHILGRICGFSSSQIARATERRAILVASVPLGTAISIRKWKIHSKIVLVLPSTPLVISHGEKERTFVEYQNMVDDEEPESGEEQNSEEEESESNSYEQKENDECFEMHDTECHQFKHRESINNNTEHYAEFQGEDSEQVLRTADICHSLGQSGELAFKYTEAYQEKLQTPLTDRKETSYESHKSSDEAGEHGIQNMADEEELESEEEHNSEEEESESKSHEGNEHKMEQNMVDEHKMEQNMVDEHRMEQNMEDEHRMEQNMYEEELGEQNSEEEESESNSEEEHEHRMHRNMVDEEELESEEEQNPEEEEPDSNDACHEINDIEDHHTPEDVTESKSENTELYEEFLRETSGIFEQVLDNTDLCHYCHSFGHLRELTLECTETHQEKVETPLTERKETSHGGCKPLHDVVLHEHGMQQNMVDEEELESEEEQNSEEEASEGNSYERDEHEMEENMVDEEELESEEEQNAEEEESESNEHEKKGHRMHWNLVDEQELELEEEQNPEKESENNGYERKENNACHEIHDIEYHQFKHKDALAESINKHTELYAEFHRENPGFFQQVLDTSDLCHSFGQLRELALECIEMYQEKLQAPLTERKETSYGGYNTLDEAVFHEHRMQHYRNCSIAWSKGLDTFTKSGQSNVQNTNECANIFWKKATCPKNILDATLPRPQLSKTRYKQPMRKESPCANFKLK